MSNTNRYITQDAAVIDPVIDITTPATHKTKIQAVIDFLSLEGVDGSTQRGFLDEMSPACRNQLVSELTALKAVIADAP